MNFLAIDIFENLDCQSILACRLVCKEWQELIDDQKSWISLRKEFHGLKTNKFHFYSDELFIEKLPHWSEVFDYLECHESLHNLRIFVKFMQKWFADSNVRLSETPMHSAAQRGNTEIVSMLIKSPLDFNDTDVHGHTPLHLAFENRHTKVLNLILRHSEVKRIKFNAVSIGGWTPMHKACYVGNAQGLKLFLEDSNINRIEVNARDEYDRTPFHLACCYGELKIVELLIKYGVDTKAKDDQGRTPLMVAQERGYIEIVELLR